MIQKETKWSVHLDKIETQVYLCEIDTKKSGTVALRKRAEK